MIPKEIHYLFGLDKDFCNKSFSYFHYLNVLSAKQINVEYKINLYYLYKPESVYFDKLYDICNVIIMMLIFIIKNISVIWLD